MKFYYNNFYNKPQYVTPDFSIMSIKNCYKIYTKLYIHCRCIRHPLKDNYKETKNN